ncbi:YqaJ viral recombinase family nuclease [Edaphobacillus lindanitolerans]|uniref:Putative phage-type endonuclease n=1 Tax=Edaphobacillus lindanitolerans TaxID=550447 RepID=A0A1U7PTA9_9BACI|nr:YqaJ viral recombinase family protein [Edaphobacillus lindanitolerans]SIT91532.1 putative phage-type endonuclease [Edaphobacillus lindanitolerans]
MQAESLKNVLHIDRSEWLQERRKGLGGSDAGVILGLNKWKSPFQLYLEKTGEYTEEVDNEFIYWGNQLEDMVAQEFAKRTGKKVRRNNRMLIHPEHDFMRANIDRVVVGERAILECKTTSAWNAEQWEGEDIPASYICQVQHYLAVTGYEKAYFAVLIGGNRFVWKEIDRDDELIDIIIDREKHFWEEHVLAGVPPEIDGSPAAGELLAKLYPEDDGETAMLTKSDEELLEALESVKGEIKELDTLKKQYENKLKMTLANSPHGVSPRFEVTYRAQVRNTIDSKRLREEMPDIAEKFTKQSKTRVLRIKQIEEAN